MVKVIDTDASQVLHNMKHLDLYIFFFSTWSQNRRPKRHTNMRMKGPAPPLCLLPPSAQHLPPSSVLWASNPAETTWSVSITIMSAMERSTAEMAQMRTNAYRIVKRVNGLCLGEGVCARVYPGIVGCLVGSQIRNYHHHLAKLVLIQ